MIRITYTSSATQTITPSMILDILEAARDFNGNRGVTREDVAERDFKDWSMAFVDTSTAEVARVLVGHGLDSYEAQQWPMERTSQLLASFANALRAERIPVRY
ncbi:MAG: hypothetical protein DI582_08765 [Azospirillum brasilense]|nr:MAG: hypothetical protein DI582_08765 [Azospirillum brasilense]